MFKVLGFFSRSYLFPLPIVFVLCRYFVMPSSLQLGAKLSSFRELHSPTSVLPLHQQTEHLPMRSTTLIFLRSNGLSFSETKWRSSPTSRAYEARKSQAYPDSRASDARAYHKSQITTDENLAERPINVSSASRSKYGSSSDRLSEMSHSNNEQGINLTSITEVAGNAKSFLSTAAQSVFKTVAEAAATASTAIASKSATPAAGEQLLIGKTRVTIVRQLAEGGFGLVYLAQQGRLGETPSRMNKQFALKILNCQSAEQLRDAQHELDVLLQFLDNPYIVTLLDYSAVNGSIKGVGCQQMSLLFPLYTRGTAMDAIERAGGSTRGPAGPPWPFPEVTAIYTIWCTAQALLAMHRSGLAHRDIKPHNILIANVLEEAADTVDHVESNSAQDLAQILSINPNKSDRRLQIGMGRAVLMDLGSTTSAVIRVLDRRTVRDDKFVSHRQLVVAHIFVK